MEKLQKNPRKLANIFHSIRTRMMALTVCGVILAVVIILLSTIPKSKDNLESSIQSNMYDISTAYMNLLDKTVELSGNNNLSTQELTTILSGMHIKNVGSSYLYLVDEKGTVLYHPKKEKIGVPLDNSLINELTKAIQNGKYTKSDIREYVSTDGIQKYASYSISDKTHWILVVTADKSDILSPINSMVTNSILYAFLLIVVLGILSFIFSSSIIKPINKLSKVVEKTAELDFSTDSTIEKLAKRKDETGQISCMTIKMQNNLRDMIKRIENSAENLVENAENLEKLATDIDSVCTDNSATSEELAASMEETSATVETIDSNVVHIQSGSGDIYQMSIKGLDMSKEIQDRAENLHTSSISAKEETVKMYDSVKQRSQQAIEQLSAVEKINVLSSTIQDIASQTSLLSLNASIEAARAGESGKGFAVVASEIGKLADQSSSTVNNILDIVSEIHNSVDNMSDCLRTILEFLDKKVMTDYSEFVDVSMKYSSDADTIQLSMNEINNIAKKLAHASDDIATAISGINTTIGDAATGVNDIAEKTTIAATSTNEVTVMVHKTNELAEELDKITKLFRL